MAVGLFKGNLQPAPYSPPLVINKYIEANPLSWSGEDVSDQGRANLLLANAVMLRFEATEDLAMPADTTGFLNEVGKAKLARLHWRLVGVIIEKGI